MEECAHKGKAYLIDKQDTYGIYLCTCGQSFIRMDEEEQSDCFGMLSISDPEGDLY